MTEIEKSFLVHTSEVPLLRKLMNKDEIKIANKLVKEGYMQKGISNDKQKSVIYYAI